MSDYVLFDFPRSSASFRVRIALALKNIAYERHAIDLREGEQRSDSYRNVNPAGLVPTLVLPDGTALTQSLAIMRYLESISGPPLFPADPLENAIVSAMALLIACDIHPLNNLRALNYIQKELGASDAQKSAYYAHWVCDGFAALNAEVGRHGGRYCYGDTVTVADICLVPQMANARRFDVDVSEYPHLVKRDAALMTLEAFQKAVPSEQ